MSRLLAIDPSLTCSGWALFGVASGELLAVGKITSLPPTTPLSQRLRGLQDEITGLLENAALGVDDYLVCEGATTVKDPSAAFKVEQVRGIFETLARNRSIAVPGRLNPRSVQKELMGLHGKQLNRKEVKANAREVFRQMYLHKCAAFGWKIDDRSLSAKQDMIDAALVGALAVSRIKLSGRDNVYMAFMEKRDERRVVR